MKYINRIESDLSERSKMLPGSDQMPKINREKETNWIRISILWQAGEWKTKKKLMIIKKTKNKKNKMKEKYDMKIENIKR